MVILVDKGTEEAIGRQVDQCLEGKYQVGADTLNVAWPEKGSDDYGFHRESETSSSGTESSIRRALNPIRAKAIKLRDQYIEEYSNKAG